MGHTPGPWQFTRTEGAQFHMIGTGDVVVAGIPNCDQYLEEGEIDKVSNANAHLIAESPDMLNTMERVIAGVEKHADAAMKKRLDFHLRMMKASVARAKGE